MNIHAIPSDYYLPAKHLAEQGFSYSDLKAHAHDGGILKRHKSKKTRRVYYKNKNLRLVK